MSIYRLNTQFFPNVFGQAHFHFHHEWQQSISIIFLVDIDVRLFAHKTHHKYYRINILCNHLTRKHQQNCPCANGNVNMLFRFGQKSFEGCVCVCLFVWPPQISALSNKYINICLQIQNFGPHSSIILILYINTNII